MVQSKKTKKNKVADFSKPKLKLGKGKQLATNSTDTSFKSRSIALPTQSIAIQKEQGLPTIRRNLTLDQLLIQTKHYSVAVRKDGLLGVREFLTSHPRMLGPNLNAIVGATTRSISDEDAGVRNAVYQLYAQIFSALPGGTLIPHADVVLLHTTSALSHIFADVRVDSLQFLDLMMDKTPSVLNKSRVRVLDGYLSLLGLRGKVGDSSIVSHGATYGRLSISAKARVLNSLLRFVKNTLAFSSLAHSIDADADLSGDIPSWIFRPSFVTRDAFNCFIRALSRPKEHDTKVYWQAMTDELAEADGADENGTGWDLEWLDDLKPSHCCTLEDLQVLDELEGKKSDEYLHCLVDLSQLIHSVLVSTFLDVAPGVFTARDAIGSRSTSQSAEIDLLGAIGELALLIYGPLLRAEGSGKIDASAQVGAKARLVLEKLAIYFPFGTRGDVPLDVNSEQVFYDLGLSYCELASLFVLLGTHDASGGRVVASPPSPVGQMEEVSDWVVQTLRIDVTMTGSYPLVLRLSASRYSALLPTIWSLLNASTGKGTGEGVWSAVVDHCERLSATSPVKKLAIEFVARLVLLQSERYYRGSFKVDLAFATRWMESLPRVLWELGVQEPTCTETILRILHVALQRGMVEGGVASLLVPYFGVSHPTKGWIAGPWGRFVGFENLRRLAVDVMVTAMSLVDGPRRTRVRLAVDDAVESCVPTEDVGRRYWSVQRSRVMG